MEITTSLRVFIEENIFKVDGAKDSILIHFRNQSNGTLSIFLTRKESRQLVLALVEYLRITGEHNKITK